MFITIEDETGIANLVIWPSLYEKQRRIFHSAGMMAVHGRIQREGGVVHLVSHRLTDLSGKLASIGDCDAPFPTQHGYGDGAKHGGGPDSREGPVRKTWDIHMPVQQFDTIKVKARDFR
jgi:error-prone DNA polymerase